MFLFPVFLIGLQHEGIFRVSGSQVEVNDIKNAFERGKKRFVLNIILLISLSTHSSGFSE